MSTIPSPEDTETYRDKIATVDEKGKRIWVYPKRPKGRFYNARTYVSWGLLAILFGLPFIKVNGEPLILFNILERNFIIFGIHFTPQDFHLFVFAMLTFLVFIVLFTVIYGRIFCGWVCPQTIFMEMVFRKIEYWIEGDATAQRRLDKAPWTMEKIRKKAAKQAIFIVISILIAHTFLSYIVGLERVTEIVTQSPMQNPGGFFAMIGFTGAFYYVFSSLREQVCTSICPYGRLQGVMTDRNTILVSYDFVRGEPRGKIRKNKKTNPLETIQSEVTSATLTTPENSLVSEAGPLQITGDCIDCHLCVKVCPTGIDIRDGVQMECVHCTACMDVCDEVMDKVGRDRGLIRYDSYNGIETKQQKIFNTRVIAYTVVLGLLILANIFFLSNRSDIEAVILRTPGMLYQKVDETHISNLYSYQVFNKTNKEFPLEFRLKSDFGNIKFVGDEPTAKSREMAEGAFFIEMEKDKLASRKNKIYIEVYSNGELLDKVKTTFFGPVR
ncbi:MAG: cytochrome c oxidase accessory protein CcoG [Saprospiraceae bacterium]|nr:MAG: cytochrome c oxidase accessory protein CcoG [Saprospiraceae bacterium]